METRLNNMEVSNRSSAIREGSEYEDPQGDLEQELAQMWKDLFHLDRIGRHDNFFELGGNSLLGLDLSEMFALRLELEVPALMIFQHPTIAALAQLIESQ